MGLGSEKIISHNLSLPTSPKFRIKNFVTKIPACDGGVAKWTCPCCGGVQGRNCNAAQNILVRGLLDIEKENSSSGSGRADEADVNKDSEEKLSMGGNQESGIPCLWAWGRFK